MELTDTTPPEGQGVAAVLHQGVSNQKAIPACMYLTDCPDSEAGVWVGTSHIAEASVPIKYVLIRLMWRIINTTLGKVVNKNVPCRK